MAETKAKSGFRGPAGAGMATRFKPGQVANPYGHGGKLRALRDAYKDDLGQIDPKTGLTYAQLVSKQVVKKALAGNMQAVMELANRTEGKPMQPIHLESVISDKTAETIAEVYNDCFRDEPSTYASPEIRQPRALPETPVYEAKVMTVAQVALDTRELVRKHQDEERARELMHEGKPFPSIG